MAETELPEISVNGTLKRRREEEQQLPPAENNEQPHLNPSNPEQEEPRVVVNSNPDPILVVGEGLPPPPVEAELPANTPLEGIWMVAKNLTPGQKEALTQFKAQHNEIATENRGDGTILITGIEDAKLAAELALELARNTKVKLKDESQGKAVSEEIVLNSSQISNRDTNNNFISLLKDGTTNAQKDLIKQALGGLSASEINLNDNNTITAKMDQATYSSLVRDSVNATLPLPIVTEAPNANTDLYSRSDVSPPINAVSQDNVVFNTSNPNINLDTLQPITNQEPLQNMVVTSQIPATQNEIPSPFVVGASNLGQLNTLSINVSR